MVPHAQALTERRSLVLHRRVAERLREDPTLLLVARQRVAAWIAAGHRSSYYLNFWREILERPVEDVIAALLEDSEGGRELRGASPFAGIVTPKERWAIWRSEREALEAERR